MNEIINKMLMNLNEAELDQLIAWLDNQDGVFIYDKFSAWVETNRPELAARIFVKYPEQET